MSENSIVAIILGLVSLSGILSTAYLTRKIPASQKADVIQVQGKTLSDAFNEINELRGELRKSERLQKIQWTYILRLIEEYRDHDLIPPAPPKELETDPEIVRLITEIKERRLKRINAD